MEKMKMSGLSLIHHKVPIKGSTQHEVTAALQGHENLANSIMFIDIFLKHLVCIECMVKIASTHLSIGTIDL